MAGKEKEKSPSGKATKIEVFNLRLPNFPVEQSPVDKVFKEFQRFGSDNLFPQQVSRLNRQGTTHRAILNSKTSYTIGKGFLVDEGNEELSEYILNVNSDNESLRAVVKKVAFDFNAYGNAYIEIVTNQSRDFLSLFHKHSPRARVSKDGSKIILHPDWAREAQSKDLKTVIPLYPVFEESEIDGFLHSIIHIKDYEPEFEFYGLPRWLAALEAVAIGHKTNKWNVSRLDNQFSVSALLEIYGNPDDEEIIKGKKAIKDEHTNANREGNNNKLIVITKEPGGGPNDATKYTPFVQTQEGDWINLHKQSDQDLIIGHNWFRSLAGLGEPGQLGNTQQIRNEYEIAKNTTIAEIQDILMEPIKMILVNEGGFDVEGFRINNQPPVNLADQLDLNMVVFKKEARRMIGMEVDETDDRMNEFIATERVAQNGDVTAFAKDLGNISSLIKELKKRALDKPVIDIDALVAKVVSGVNENLRQNGNNPVDNS